MLVGRVLIVLPPLYHVKEITAKAMRRQDQPVLSNLPVERRASKRLFLIWATLAPLRYQPLRQSESRLTPAVPPVIKQQEKRILPGLCRKCAAIFPSMSKRKIFLQKAISIFKAKALILVHLPN